MKKFLIVILICFTACSHNDQNTLIITDENYKFDISNNKSFKNSVTNHFDNFEISHNPEDIIVPCRCNGTMKYVHRACLQEWRIQDIDSPNFRRCNQCLYEYQTYDNTSKCHLCFSNFCHFYT